MAKREQENRARANYSAWKRSSYTDVYHAYGSISKGKRDAWDYCVDLCKKYNGEGLKVISRNCHKFTAGFEYVDKETGEIMFMYITKGYDQAVPVAM